MSYRQVIAWLALASCQMACARTEGTSVSLDLGHPFAKQIMSQTVAFDGRDELTVGGQIVRARTPAILYVNRGGHWLLNYGDGSGQVYSLDFHAGPSSAGDSHVRRQLFRKAQAAGCNVKPDEISLLFEAWTDEDAFIVSSENWSRREECPVIGGKHRLRYQGGQLELE